MPERDVNKRFSRRVLSSRHTQPVRCPERTGLSDSAWEWHLLTALAMHLCSPAAGALLQSRAVLQSGPFALGAPGTTSPWHRGSSQEVHRLGRHNRTETPRYARPCLNYHSVGHSLFKVMARRRLQAPVRESAVAYSLCWMYSGLLQDLGGHVTHYGPG